MTDRSTTPALDLALHHSESFVRQLLESSQDCIKILDLNGRLKYINAPGMRLLNIETDAHYLDRDWLTFWCNDDQAAVRAAIVSAKAGGIGKFQGFCATMSGVSKWWDVVVTPIRDNVGRIEQLLSISRDITVAKRLEADRKQAETALHQRNAILNSINELTPTLMFVKDRDGRVLVANPAVVAAVGKPIEEILGKTSLQFHEPREEAEKIMENDRLVIESGRFHQFEEQLDSADGWRVFLSTKSPYRDDQGNVIGIVGITSDITDRKRTEAALHDSNARLEVLYETSRDLLSSEQPIALIDTVFQKLKAQCNLDFYLNYLVDRAGEHLQLTSWSGISEAIAIEYAQLEVGQAICGTVAQTQCQIVVSDVQCSTDPKTSLIRALGVTAYASQPLIAGGRLFGTLSFASCTRTAFTEAETDLMQALCDQMAIAIERAELIDSLQQQTEQLREANRLKDEFLAVLSHELRTPLNPILGWTKMLQSRRLDDAKTYQALTTIERNAKLQSQLIEDLLDISRIMRGKLSLNPDTVCLSTIVSAAIDTIRLAADAKSITITVAFDSDDSCVFGDPARLQQVVWNLLSNAVKFTPDRGQIYVQLVQTARHVTLQVADTGKGIHADFLPYLFEYFRQQDGSTTRQFGGLGLGLAIVREIVELHGGTIHAASDGEGQGATFTVDLPIAPQTVQRRSEKARIEPSIQPSPTLKKAVLLGVSVLIVDDEPDTRDFLAFLLQEHGAIVTLASSAIEALRLLEVIRPDLILSDIGMPDMNGYSLMQSIRQSGKIVPAIALSAYAGDLDQKRALAAGFQHHLAKPIDPETVIETIAQLIHAPVSR